MTGGLLQGNPHNNWELNVVWWILYTVKPVYNDHLYNKMFYLCLIQ